MACLQGMKAFSLIHYLAGFYTGEGCLPAYKVYRNLSDALIFVVLSSTVCQLLTSQLEHKESLSVSCVVCIAYTLALYYSLCFQVQHQKISQIFSLLEKIIVSLTEVTDEGAITKSFQLDMKRYTRNAYFGLFASFMSAFLFSVQPLLRSAAFLGMDGNKQLQIDTWCPFDLQTGYVFEATVTIQFFTVFWVALRFFANNSFFMFLMKGNIRLFEHLIAFGENVIELNPVLTLQTKDAGQKCRKRLHLRLLQPILEHRQFGDDLRVQISEIQREFHFEQSERNMKLFIKNHQLILRCSSETCQIYGPVMLMYLLSLMAFASTGAFGVLHTKGFQGIQSIAVSFFSVANLLFLYQMSRTGDDLSQKEVGNNVFGQSSVPIPHEQDRI
ncbi:hypothetical protein J6590_007110 [Homalodisca vitripennis]|nr:hypothetical protein J6590_007110 [Homalodisca vitripennis]